MTFTLLDLPFELRMIIWALLCPLLLDASGNLKTLSVNFGDISSAGWMRENSNDAWLVFHRLGSVISPGILRTCRLFDNELAPFIYGQQVIGLVNTEMALKWLRSIGRVNWSHIRHIHLAEPDWQGKFIPTILAGMPNLKSLDIFGTYLIRYRCRPSRFPTPLHTSVTKAIASLPHLHHLHLGSNAYNVELAKDNPTLERLTVEVGPLINNHFANAFKNLPNLKHLSLLYCGYLTPKLPVLPKDFFTRLAPLQSFEYYGGYLSSTQIEDLTNRHGSTLRSLNLQLPGSLKALSEIQQEELTERHLPNFAQLFRNLPRLHVLKIYAVEIHSEMLTIMPPSLEILDYRFHCCGIVDLDSNIKSLALQCPSLKHFRFSSYDTPKLMVSPCELSPGFHDALDFLSAKGVGVVSPSCLAYGCRPHGKFEHLRRRPCRHTIKATYRDDFRLRQPILSTSNGGSPWKLFPDDERIRVCRSCCWQWWEYEKLEDCLEPHTSHILL